MYVCISCFSGLVGNDIGKYVAMETTDSGEIEVPLNQDPVDVYLDAIFYPGRFSVQSIVRTLNVSMVA